MFGFLRRRITTAEWRPLPADTRWYAVVRDADGELISVGSEGEITKRPPAGLIVVPCKRQELWEEWDTDERRFIDLRPADPMIAQFAANIGHPLTT